MSGTSKKLFKLDWLHVCNISIAIVGSTGSCYVIRFDSKDGQYCCWYVWQDPTEKDKTAYCLAGNGKTQWTIQDAMAACEKHFTQRMLTELLAELSQTDIKVQL